MVESSLRVVQVNIASVRRKEVDMGKVWLFFRHIKELFTCKGTGIRVYRRLWKITSDT